MSRFDTTQCDQLQISHDQLSTLLTAPQNCEWSEWNWEDCSRTTCGTGGQSGNRTIIQHATDGGKACTGGPTTTRMCNPPLQTATAMEDVEEHAGNNY